MAANLILLLPTFTCFFFFFFFFFFFTLASQDQQNNNHNLLLLELRDAKLKISLLQSVLEERIQSINAKTLYLRERDKFLDDMTNKITFLQSALSNLKDHSLLSDERLKALEEEAQDAEDRLEVVTSQVEKMAEVVTEQWIQIQHLEQALQIAEMRALQAQRQRDMRCTFLKLQGFIKQEMRRNELAAAFVNDELASALITFPILGAWMLLLSQFS